MNFSYLQGLHSTYALHRFYGMDMIDRVARALCHQDHGSLSLVDDGGVGRWEAMGGIQRGFWCDQARAAIEAMRDYTFEMSSVGGAVGRIHAIPVGERNQPVGQSIAERVYLAMIDEALRSNV